MWKIQRINTRTGHVTMAHLNGVELELVIPQEHHKHPHKANEFLFSACKEHEKTKAFRNPAQKMWGPPAAYPYVLSILAYLAVFTVVTWLILFMRFRK